MSEPVIEALEETWSATATVCRDLDPGAWDLPTDCPGWTVRDHLSHLIGTERSLLGEVAPSAPDPMPEHVRNPIGRGNEAWIAARRTVPGVDVLAEFREVTARRLHELRSFPPERWEAVGWSPVGDAPYRQYMEIRAFDSWVHGQDIRWAIDRPGDRYGRGEAVSIGRIELAMPVVVGRRVGPPDGTTVVFEVEGTPARTLALEMVDGRARAVDHPPAEPTVRLRLPAVDFVLLGCGRESGALALDHGGFIDGDPGIGRAVLDAMNVMI